MTAQSPEKFNGESVLLAGDSLPVGEAQRIYTEHSGQKSSTLPHFVARIFGEWVMPDIGLMMKWFKEEVRRRCLDLRPSTHRCFDRDTLLTPPRKQRRCSRR
jgi:hypothetical protein